MKRDYRELRQMANQFHDRFSELNYDTSLSLNQKFNALLEYFKTIASDWEDVLEYLEEFEKNFDTNLYNTVFEILDKWLKDGILGNIIERIFDKLSFYTPLEFFDYLFVEKANGFVDITYALREAIDTVEKGSTIIFRGTEGKKYMITCGCDDELANEAGTVFTINKALTIDFNNIDVQINAENKTIFELQFSGENDFNNRISLLNYSFRSYMSCTINKLFYINGAINTTLNGSVNKLTATHSMLHNYSGYGTRISGEIRNSSAPRYVYLSHSSGIVHSFNFYSDMDITSNDGKGFEIEGGNGEIKGVIENVTGGIDFNGVHILTGFKIDSVHFEANREYDVKIGSIQRDSTGATNTGIVTITNTLFSLPLAPTNNNVIFGNNHTIILENNFLTSEPKPIDVTTSDCLIYLMGNIKRSFPTLATNTRHRMVSISPEDSILNTLKIGALEATSLKVPRVDSNNLVANADKDLALYPNNGANGAILTIGQNGVLPKNLSDNGGQFNRTGTFYGRYLNLLGDDGNAYRIYVGADGLLKTVKV